MWIVKPRVLIAVVEPVVSFVSVVVLFTTKDTADTADQFVWVVMLPVDLKGIGMSLIYVQSAIRNPKSTIRNPMRKEWKSSK